MWFLVQVVKGSKHFEDYVEMRNLEVPEWSHLSRDSAARFTRAYVELIMQKVPWLATPPGEAAQ